MADDSAQEGKIAEFSAVTGADSDRAKFFLESSNWQIQVALDQFFDNSGDAAFEDASEDMPEEIPVVADPPAQAGDTAPAGRKTSGSRFATLSDMMRDEPDNSDSDEEGQAYYAGGSDHGTGQQVVGPKKKKEERDSLVNNLFKQAKEHGAQEVSAGLPVSGPGQSSYVFRGAAYRLGESEDEPVHPVPGTAGTMPEKPPEQRHIILKLWKNGFSIDDGDLRDYKDPKNAALLNSVSRGEIPMELVREAKGGEVNLDMEDHRQEEYVRPKKKVTPFAGHGYMLGSPTPNVLSSPATGAATASAGSSSTDNKGNEKSAQESIGLDTSQPVTNVQLRLGDGTRLVGKFNHTHTVGDIRRYISLARPALAGQTYVLMTTFPNKELTDDSQSLADAKLLNAVIVQRIK
ncbi:NSFL1 cofactor p47-like [Amphiura filiformis]|uniref:NSFL1 cofactor p47-like n=1 Tax=Amphiura filiformis TaxID=82378 RepID=UPI003B2276F2